MTTKGELVNSAYEELRISGLTTNPTPEDVTLAIKLMDRMVAQWRNKTLCLGYEDTVDSVNPSQNSGLATQEEDAVIQNLAVRLSPAFGKQPQQETKASAKEAYDNLFSTELTYRESDPYLPQGAGHYAYYSMFFVYDQFQQYEENAPSNCDTADLIIDQTDYFSVDFTTYLNQVEGQVIDSITVEGGDGVEVLESSNDDYNVQVKVQGKIEGFARVKILIVTSGANPRQLPYYLGFNVKRY